MVDQLSPLYIYIRTIPLVPEVDNIECRKARPQYAMFIVSRVASIGSAYTKGLVTTGVNPMHSDIVLDDDYM